MLEAKKTTCLLDELKQLAEVKKIADFNFSTDIDSLPAGERETAFLLKKVLDNFKTAAEYELMRYRLTGESLCVGYWDMAITGGNAVNLDNLFIWSPELRRMLGYADDAGNADFSGTLASWLEHLHPDDRDEAIEAFVAHTADRTGKTQFVTEYRLRKTSGEYISIRAFGTALRDDAGIPVRIAGAVEDITEYRKTWDALFHCEKTQDILNRVALVLLVREEKSFGEAMTESLGLIAGIADIDRMSVFRNSEKPDGRYLSQIYRWRKNANGTVDVRKELSNVPYSSVVPQFELSLASGESIAGHVNSLPGCEAFKRFGCETILAIPVFDNGNFWGTVLFERLSDKTFAEQEAEVLRLASFMLSNAVIRNEEATLVRRANEQAQLMLDAAPLAITMWDKNFRVIDCSQTALDVFGYSSKQELAEHFVDSAPEYQPDGRLSMDVLAEAATEAFQTGSCRLEWTGRDANGEPIVFEDTAVRVKYKNEHALMLYSRDIRDEKNMLAGLKVRDEMLILQTETIRQTNEQIQTMLDAIPAAITIWDRDGHVLNCSQYAVDLIGYSSKQELIDRLHDHVPEFQPCGKKSEEKLAESSAKAFQTGYDRIEWTQLTAGGEPILLDAQAIRIKYRGDYALLLFSRDIREEKRMLNNLAERDEMLEAQAYWYKSLLDGIPLPISVIDANMNLTFTNTTAENVFGRNREELIGLPCNIWKTPNCGTGDCSVVRAKQGQKQSYFKFGGISCKTDTEIIYDEAGETIGYLEVLHDITDVENLARRQADAANEAKSAFLAQMSHEMRTPLSAVIGLSELVLENGGLSDNNEVYLDKIYNAGSTLLGIVNDILDISKIEAGRLEIIPQEYDVPSLINDTITQNILRIHSKPVHFTLDVDENVPARLRGDDIRVKQILSNLLSNAFKYTDEGAVELRIGYERDGDSVWTTFRVSDTGIGMKAEDIGRLFTDYTRFDGEINRKIGGTGLGLSITKRLVELMGGNIIAESEYGKGSVFTARIRQQFVNESVIGREMAEHLRRFLYTTSKRRSGAQLQRLRIPYARVLVVDDNKTNLDIAQGLMRPYGMGIDCVTDGQSAIDAIREEKVKYSAIFMDHMMPGMDGVEAVRIIREEIGSEYAKHIPIVALTANALAGNQERYISQGFNAFVSKPIDIFRLDAVIRKWIWDEKKGPGDSRVFVERRQRTERRQGVERHKGGDRRKSERKDGTPLPAASEVIEGLDWMKGIELFGGADAFRQVLMSFVVNTKALLNGVSEVSEETLPQYTITVHGIKSSSRGIGAYALGSMAESLEFAAKDGNLDFVSLHNPDFLAVARKLIADIETVMDKTAKADAKPCKDRPDDAELTRLCAACENYDMDEIEAVMREIERYDYTADDGLAGWLCDNIAKLNYAQVTEKITQVMKVVSE